MLPDIPLAEKLCRRLYPCARTYMQLIYIENEAGQITDVGRFLQLADRYSDLQELNASTVNELIHKPEPVSGTEKPA